MIDIIASVSNRSLDEVSINSRLPDLGFDSLMFVELATAIENAGGALTAPERLNEVQDVRELLGVVNRQGVRSLHDARRPGCVWMRKRATTRFTFLSFCARLETKAST